MAQAEGILIGKGPAPDFAPAVLLQKFGNRHGLIESAYERLAERAEPATQPRASTRVSAGERLIGNLAASVGREIGRQLIRDVLGTWPKGSRR